MSRSVKITIYKLAMNVFFYHLLAKQEPPPSTSSPLMHLNVHTTLIHPSTQLQINQMACIKPGLSEVEINNGHATLVNSAPGCICTLGLRPQRDIESKAKQG